PLFPARISELEDHRVDVAGTADPDHRERRRDHPAILAADTPVHRDVGRGAAKAAGVVLHDLAEVRAAPDPLPRLRPVLDEVRVLKRADRIEVLIVNGPDIAGDHVACLAVAGHELAPVSANGLRHSGASKTGAKNIVAWLISPSFSSIIETMYQSVPSG